jgi:hypothetical protein
MTVLAFFGGGSFNKMKLTNVKSRRPTLAFAD